VCLLCGLWQVILVTRSEHFRALLTGGMAESQVRTFFAQDSALPRFCPPSFHGI
jgi:hypothetical protein